MKDNYKVMFTVELEIETSFGEEITADEVLDCLKDNVIGVKNVTNFSCEKIEEE